MKKLSDITSWATELDKRLPESALKLFSEGLLLDPFDKVKISASEWIINHINSSPCDHLIRQGNIIDTEKSRWGKVYCRKYMNWDVRARISQTKGIELTRAQFRNRLVIRNHQMVPYTYLLRRARCRFGPFACTFSDGFVVGALYCLAGGESVLQLFWFKEDGRATSQLLQTKEIFGSFAFNFKILAEKLIYKDKNSILKEALNFPKCLDSIDIGSKDKIICVNSCERNNCWFSFNGSQKYRCTFVESICRKTKLFEFGICFEVQGDYYAKVIDGPILEVSQLRSFNGDGLKRKT
ncbi:MAG: hypothetical protein R2883_01305 [Caldisericia bacterium]